MPNKNLFIYIYKAVTLINYGAPGNVYLVIFGNFVRFA